MQSCPSVSHGCQRVVFLEHVMPVARIMVDLAKVEEVLRWE